MQISNSRQQLQNLDARIDSRVEAIRAERSWWPCRRGCDQCCRQLARPLELSAEEWARVDEAIATLPKPARAEVEQNVAALLAQIAAGTVAAPVVCPFLDLQEGACRIYDSRPIACRTYGFFVARDHDQYCQMVEAEVASQGDRTIVWGNAIAIQHAIEQISGNPIPFEVHYQAEANAAS